MKKAKQDKIKYYKLKKTLIINLKSQFYWYISLL